MKCFIFILVLTLFALAALTVAILLMRTNSLEQNVYSAAVVEYNPVEKDSNLSFKDYMLRNVDEYEQLIQTASDRNTDIIVFPEAGLTDTRFEKTRAFLSTNLIEIPDPQQNVTPWRLPDGACHEVLQKISLAAYSYNMYVVINIPEKYKCSTNPDCPADGFFFYNTNIVFDRQGSIIARYRKYNLFLEPEFSATKPAEICTFETDFGVTFGMFVCFDILFENPAIRLLRETNVKDIIYSAAWFSELPFLYAVGVQAGWSHSMDVNLLASTLNTRKHGGSGIYAGKEGVLVAEMPKEIGTKIYFAEVPIKAETPSHLLENIHHHIKEFTSTPAAENINHFNVKEYTSLLATKVPYSLGRVEYLQDPSLPLMRSKILEPTTNQDQIKGVVFETELNYAVPQFESSVKVRWSINKKYDAVAPRYRLFSFFGDRTFSGARTATIAVCGIVACSNESLESCGLIPNQDSVKTTLHSVNITIRSKSITEGYIPITSDLKIEPLPVKRFQFSKLSLRSNNSEEYEIKMSSLEPLDNVLSFAVYKIPLT